MKDFVRVQRKRTKGWRMPLNTVYVGRGTVWGNPFYLENGLVKIKAPSGQIWLEGGGDIHTALSSYRRHIERKISCGEVDISILKGKNLACWCDLDSPCHADILLEMVNAKH